MPALAESTQCYFLANHILVAPDRYDASLGKVNTPIRISFFIFIIDSIIDGEHCVNPNVSFALDLPVA